MKIFSNFIPNGIKTFTDSDPPGMTKDIKNKIKEYILPSIHETSNAN